MYLLLIVTNQAASNSWLVCFSETGFLYVIVLAVLELTLQTIILNTTQQRFAYLCLLRLKV